MIPDLEKLKEEQRRLAQEIVLRDDFDKIKLIAGVDCSYFSNNKKIVAAVIVCDFKTMNVVEKKYSVLDANFPYISGFLSYRESPAIVDAFNKLNQKPDMLLVDGNGILHPRKFGLASHLSLLLNIPSIGISKSIMCGSVKAGKIYVENDMLGIQIKTKENSNPLYISPGNRISIGTAFSIIEKSMKQPHKLPEPLHIAHRYADHIKDLQEKWENKDNIKVNSE